MNESLRPAGPLLADPALTRQAALLGHGVMLGDLLMHDDLKAGSLVVPFKLFVKVGMYWLVARDLAALSDPAKQVAAWLQGEVKRTLAGVEPILAQAVNQA